MWITDGEHVACCVARQINPCHTEFELQQRGYSRVKPCPRGLLWRTRCNLLYMWITDGKHVACCIARQINPCHTGLSFNSGVIPGLSRAPEDLFGGHDAVRSICESRMGNTLPAALLPLAYWLELQQRPWLSCAPEDFHYSTGISGCGERLSVVRVLSPGPIMFLEVKRSGL